MSNFVVGDVHGCFHTLVKLINQLPMESGDKLIFVGDYIDRGPHSKQVVDFVKELTESGQAIALMGNHEKMCVDANLGSGHWGQTWMMNGGGATIESYDTRSEDERAIPPTFDTEARAKWHENLPRVSKEHVEWMASLPITHEVGDFFICHAGINPEFSLEEQREDDLLWIRNEFITYAMPLSKRVVFGHTPFKKPQILSNKIGIDTGCVFGHNLTAVCLESLEIYQEAQDDRDEMSF